jgi:hypothetical protein
MSPNHDQRSRRKPGPSKLESATTGARLDALLAPRRAGGALPSRLDQTLESGSPSRYVSIKHVPSKLDHSRQD